MNKTFLKQLRSQLKEVGLTDAKVDTAQYSDTHGFVSLEYGSCVIRFCCAKFGKRWYYPYTEHEMAHICVVAFADANRQQPTLARMTRYMIYVMDSPLIKSTTACHMEFGVDNTVRCSFRVPLVREMVVNGMEGKARLAEQRKWARWELDSVVGIERFSMDDFHNGLLKIEHLVARGRTSLIVRMAVNAMRAVEAMAKYANVPLLVEGEA